jgi:hypothetical protein
MRPAHLLPNSPALRRIIRQAVVGGGTVQSAILRVATGEVASAGNAIPLHFEAVLRRIEKRGRYGEAEDNPRFLRSQILKPVGRR